LAPCEGAKPAGKKKIGATPPLTHLIVYAYPAQHIRCYSWIGRPKIKTIVHVNQGNIRQNIKRNPSDRLPVLRAQGDFDALYGDRIDIINSDTGEIVASVVYRPDNPLSCGARVWIETDNDVVVADTI